MSKFAIMVYVDTEKSTGLIASRDEQVEKIVDELESAIDGLDISGIGARGDSEYTVTNVDTWIMDKRDEREMNEEYEHHVLEAAPKPDELKAELMRLRADRDKFQRLYETQKGIVDRIVEGAPHADSNVYQDRRGWTDEAEPRVNINPRDHIYFQYGEHRTDRLSVKWSNYDDGSIEVSADTMGREFAVLPQSGNVVRIKVIDR